MKKSIPSVARKSVVRVFGASGHYELPIFSGFPSGYASACAQNTRNNLDVNPKPGLEAKTNLTNDIELFDTLKEGGKKYAGFLSGVRDFIKYKKLETGEVTIPQLIHYSGLANMAACRIALIYRENRKDKVLKASINYLKRRYDY